MPEIDAQSGRRVVHYIVGLMAGAFMGFLALAAALSLIEPFYTGEDALSILAFAVLGFLPSIVIGAGVGIFLVRQLQRSSDPQKFVKTAASVYVAMILVGFVLTQLLIPVMDDTAQTRRNQRANALLEEHDATESAIWNSVYLTRYPHNETSLTEILGPLQYPGAEIETWTDVEDVGKGWDIVTTTKDHPDDVLAYYNSVLATGMEGYPYADGSGLDDSWSSSSSLQPSIDKLEARVTLESAPPAMRIHFRIFSPIIIVVRESVPWPQNNEPYLQHVRAAQQEYRDAIETEYADWIYPGATFAWGNLLERKSIAYDTSDSVEQVLKFYTSLKGDAHESTGRYTFSAQGSEWTPELSIYPIRGKVRIFFRNLH